MLPARPWMRHIFNNRFNRSLQNFLADTRRLRQSDLGSSEGKCARSPIGLTARHRRTYCLAERRSRGVLPGLLRVMVSPPEDADCTTLNEPLRCLSGPARAKYAREEGNGRACDAGGDLVCSRRTGRPSVSDLSLLKYGSWMALSVLDILKGAGMRGPCAQQIGSDSTNLLTGCRSRPRCSSWAQSSRR